jgi:hypothetical protein
MDYLSLIRLIPDSPWQREMGSWPSRLRAAWPASKAPLHLAAKQWNHNDDHEQEADRAAANPSGAGKNRRK